MKLCVFLLAGTVAFAFAGDITSFCDVTLSGAWHGNDAETVLFSQMVNGRPYSSQNFTDFPIYDSGCANDFQFDTQTTINKIRWWGAYYDNTGIISTLVDCPIEIYLYLDDGTGNAPTLAQHTTAIQTWMVPAGGYTETPVSSFFALEYTFPADVTFDAGQKYWVEIRKAYAFGVHKRQYGWIGTDAPLYSWAVYGFDGVTPPVVWWTSLGVDLSMELIFDDVVALHRASWAGVKTSF